MKVIAALVVLAASSCGSAAPPPPLVPTPVPTPAAKPASLTGIWLGTLAAGGKGLRLQLHLDPTSCSIDSLDQGAMGIPCEHVVASATALSLEVAAVRGSLDGSVSADASTITATWKQGGASLPIVLTRQAAAVAAKKVAMDPAMPPVELEKIQTVMDADLATMVAGELAPSTGIGVTIGVVSHGQKKIFSYGAAKPDSIFEIGSVTKTFTGLALAQLVQQKKARLDEPVRALLPKGTVAAPTEGAEITLVDLSAQRSGLPRLPDNMKPADETNPYADYDTKALYTFIAGHGVAMPAAPVVGYSNLGVGLLGQALANRAGSTYEALIQKQITGPLGMHDTAVALTPALTKRFIPGHGEGHKPQRSWEFTSLAGAGAIRSTAADMLTYLDAQLHPDHVASKTAEGKTLAAAITASHAIQADVGGGMHIALNWFRIDASGIFWHNGATGGYCSFALFDPDKDFAVVVLANRSIDDGMLADEIAKHVVQRLTGVPAESLRP